ncbi:NUDIX hydrolase [Streptomyces specialis]|uniref:hypothetical protein n=1 Tax=Streptomyces specialis TaxID=498367 RepID=UPI00073EB3F3|nr:hypothetical protein [Streptomyces specialis]
MVIVGEALVANYAGALLLVRPAGLDSCELPGRVVPPGGRDGEVAESAVRQDAGLVVRLQRLVAKDFVPASGPGVSARFHLVHKAAQVQETALRSSSGSGRHAAVRWVAREDLGSWCVPAVAARIRAAVHAAMTGTFAELDNGCPVRQETGADRCPACLAPLGPGAAAHGE